MLASASSTESDAYRAFCSAEGPKEVSEDYGFQVLYDKCKEKQFLLLFLCNFFDLVQSFPHDFIPEWINHPKVRHCECDDRQEIRQLRDANKSQSVDDSKNCLRILLQYALYPSISPYLMQEERTVFLDFDGTLTTRDTCVVVTTPIHA